MDIQQEIEFNQIIQPGEFVLICGRTGSGKTTLLNKWQKELKEKAVIVMQDPDNQIVMDKVYAELAFGLSNREFSKDRIKRRVAEIGSYFSLTGKLQKDTAKLSGGEKQILNLASALVLDPEYLLLDEPTSMLDPVMAERLISRIAEINRELLKTVIITEHRTDSLFNIADLIILVDDGKIIKYGDKATMAAYMAQNGFAELLPVAGRVFQKEPIIPLTLKEGRHHIRSNGRISRHFNLSETENSENIIIKNISFGYEKKSGLIINDLSMKIKKGGINFLVGENGSGKTTLARLLLGIYRPYSGKINLKGMTTAMLSQDVTDHFLLDEYDGRHPYDLSGGERQKLAISLIMADNPDFIILDEPTKGLDGYEKKELINVLTEIKNKGKTLLIISHDIDFMAEFADRVFMISDGEIVYEGDVLSFCRDNIFYTTGIARMWRGISEDVVNYKNALEWNGL